MTEKNCPCRRTNCERHGDCEACRAHHHGSARKPLTRCEKLAQKAQRRAEKGERHGH